MGKSKEEKEALKKAKQAAAQAAKAENKAPENGQAPAEQKPAEKQPAAAENKKPQEQQKPKDKGGKQEPAKKPAEKVETVEAEEVKNTPATVQPATPAIADRKFDGTVASLGEALGINIGKSNRLSQDKTVDLLTLTHAVIAEEQDDQRKLQMKVMFDDMHAYVLLLRYFQMYKEAGADRVVFKPEVIPFALRVFENFGVKLDPNDIRQLSDGQQEINFEKAAIEENTKEGFQKAAEIQKKSISVNPNDWTTDEMFKEGIEAILTGTAEVKTNLARGLEAVRAYRKKNEPDAKKKEAWAKVPANALYTDMVTVLGKLPIVIEGGLASSTKALVSSHKNPIMSFLKMKAHLPQFSDQDVADVTVELIKSKLGGKNLEKTEAYTKLFSNDAEYYRGLVELPALSKDATPKDKMLYEGRRVMLDLLGTAYPEVVKEDPKKNCKIINKLIEIDNYFKGPDAKLAIYDEKGYPPAAATA